MTSEGGSERNQTFLHAKVDGDDRLPKNYLYLQIVDVVVGEQGGTMNYNTGGMNFYHSPLGGARGI